MSENIPESNITVHRHPDTPHMFCPKIARELGLIAAVVEYASRDLAVKCIQPDNQLIQVSFKLTDIDRVCDYLSPEEVREASKALHDAGIWGNDA